MSLFGPPNIDKMLKKKNIAGLIKALEYEHDGPGAFVYNLVAGASKTDLLHGLWYGNRRKITYDKVNQIRTSAARALGRLGDPLAVDPLIACLDDKYFLGKKDLLLHALASIDDPRVVEPLAKKFHFADNPDTIIRVAKALQKFNDPRATEGLISMLGERDDKLRNAAVKSLIEIGDPEIAEQLAGQLVDDSNWEKPRKAAAQVLVSFGAHAVEPLVNALGDSRYSKDEITLNVFVEIGTPAVEPLIGKLNDDEERIRMFACSALGEIGDPKAIQPLIEIVKDKNKSGALREIAAKALIQLDWKPDDESKLWYALAKRDWKKLASYKAAAVEPLLVLNYGNIYTDDDDGYYAVQTLKRIGTPAVEPLITALNHSDWQVQKMAAAALGEIGDPKSVGPLKEAFKNAGWDDLGPFAMALKQMKKSLPQPKRISAEEREKALDVLNQFCSAYATSNQTAIKKLEPKVRKIGEDANERGGLMEMRRLFKKLKKSPGNRNLEFFWGGIGIWRG